MVLDVQTGVVHYKRICIKSRAWRSAVVVIGRCGSGDILLEGRRSSVAKLSDVTGTSFCPGGVPHSASTCPITLLFYLLRPKLNPGR